MNTVRTFLACTLIAALHGGVVQARHPSPGDVAPGVVDDSVMPPVHTAVGDGQVNVSDVVVVLRTAVGLVDLRHDGADPDELEALRARVEELEALLTHFTRVGDDVYVTGANLHVRNGSGTTSEPNGLGNLVVGYNEPRGFLEDQRTGSHVVVIGSRNNFSDYGGLVVGEGHELLGPWASVTAGIQNSAVGFASHVGGGRGNVASGLGASVAGGFGNLAQGDDSSVAGGSGNESTGAMASISGGTAGTAAGDGSSVSGGLLNVALGESSTVGGGEQRTAAGEGDWVAGSLSEDD